MSPIFIGEQSSTPQRSSAPGIAYRAPLLSGEPGTAQTVKLMRQLVDQVIGDASFVRLAIDIVRDIPPYNDVAEASAVYEWVKRHIRYTKDPVTKEKLYPPKELLKIRAGDCDDISMLIAAFMMALGYPARLITVGANANHPEEFSHVYIEAEVPPGSGQWIPMDAARLDSQFGVEPPMFYRKRAWSLTDDSYQDLNGCGCSGRGCSCASHVGGARAVYLNGIATVGLDGLDQGIDWGSILQQSIQEVPALVAVSSGQPTAIKNPYGTVQTGPPSPYGSFATPYTPGYGMPQAGYASPTQFGMGWFSQNWPILGMLALAFVLSRGRS